MRNEGVGAKAGTLQMVALGANLSSSGCTLEQVLARALIALAQHGFAIRAVSRFFCTPCFPEGAGPDYINAAVVLRSPWTPVQVLERLHLIEADFGRERVQRWGQRTLDLDLIAAGQNVLPDRATYQHWASLDPALQAQAAPGMLVLPHPRVQDRAFVLVPLADVAPDWVHPVLRKSVREMLSDLPEAERAGVTAI
ncbi:2-amino-4-hydroxy-6-hydroxymethyldihydropteridine diphosphokinase [Planktotalea arctica]|uniref:2-amino-4-hydroxy-6- hydroxymethyldihydropteridine diphosphokinase n=1 Tax=Planktotalea arctica TaxID=1481893 RepID=UPI00321965C7